MILIYSSQLTPRIRYTIDVVFHYVLKYEDVQLTSSKKEFSEYVGPKFSYGKQALDKEVFFKACPFLFEKRIEVQRLGIRMRNELPYFFKVDEGVLDYDPFACSFYMLSRYEEYLPYSKDQFGRFPASESLAYKNGFLSKAVVHYWALEVEAVLKRVFPDLKVPERTFTFIPTIDIDNAYAYHHKGFMRTCGAYLRDLLRMDFKRIADRTQVLLGRLKDPYDTYDLIKAMHDEVKLRPIYFILLGDYGLNDKSIPHQSKTFRSLIQSFSDYFEVGLHPSYQSNSDDRIFVKEINRLSVITKREIVRSRQHFLKLHLPRTYRKLIDNDIHEDYTMGFASETGFRAGICTAFPFFDLDLEKETNLIIHPFSIMDASLKYYKGFDPEEAMDEINKQVKEVKKVNGTLISLWHNESFSEDAEWKGWINVYKHLLKVVKE